MRENSLDTAHYPDDEKWGAAVDQALAACNGDVRAAMRALLMAKDALERELASKVSRGYLRAGTYHQLRH